MMGKSSLLGGVLLGWLVLAPLARAQTTTPPTEPQPTEPQPTQTQPTPPLPDFTSAAVPDTTGLPAEITVENQYAWDLFAWQTFIAMNWPAIEPTKDNGFLRGFPDLGKSFLEVGNLPDTPLVWETFKEKREMFKHGVRSSAEAAKPTYWNSDFLYGAQGAALADGAVKKLYSSAKFTTLDETVEVRAEALEQYYENSTNQGQPVVARVYRGGYTPASATDTGSAVRYEVKVNYDFWRYVVDSELYFDPNAQARSSRRPPVQLPWRTSLEVPGVSFLTQRAGDPPYVAGYSAAKAMTAYEKAQGTSTMDPMDAPLPPRIGAVHLKAAWAPITEKEVMQGNFIHREAEYFYTEDGVTTSATGHFGLIGLHIIQRIKVAQPNKLLNNQPLGGTFIFSTWEHVDIRETKGGAGTQYQYTNYFVDFESGRMVPIPAPSTEQQQIFDIYRLYPILPHTRRFNENIQAHFRSTPGAEVWANYRLVGTQFKPVDIKTDGTIDNQSQTLNADQSQPTPDYTMNPNSYDGPEAPGKGLERALTADEVGGQPAYLSNLVIESNLGLQQFQGLPPSVRAVPQFAARPGNSPNTSPFNFDRKAGTNVFYGGNAMNTGGCMGCHGVAQSRGYSFSFVLLGGQAGADPDTEMDFAIPFTSRNLLSQRELVALEPFAIPGGANPIVRGPDGRAVLGPEGKLHLESVHPRPADAPFQYGSDPQKNGVYLREPYGHYLTATSTPSKTEGQMEVRFTEGKTDASIWYFYDAEDPTSEGDVLQTDYLSFQNAEITVDSNPTYLTYVSPSEGSVNIVPESKVPAGRDSKQVWGATLDPLYAGFTIMMRNAGDYLYNETGMKDGSAVVGTDSATLQFEAVDGRVAGSPLFFGDSVYIRDSHGNYLAVTEDASGPTTVVFLPPTASKAAPAGSGWSLVDPFDVGSERQVMRQDLLAFRSATLTFPDPDHGYLARKPAYLTVGRATEPPVVVIVDDEPNPARQLWSLQQLDQ